MVAQIAEIAPDAADALRGIRDCALQDTGFNFIQFLIILFQNALIL